MKWPKLFGRKESAAAQTIVTNPGQPKWTPRDYGAFADEAYTKNVVAYQCINRIADAVCSVDWEAWRGETQLMDHPLLELLDRPNPLQTGDDYIRAKATYLLISGNAYDERVMVGGQVRELYSLRPDRMRVIESQNGIPAGYEYKVGSKRAVWEMDQSTLDCDIRHMRLFNPRNDWYGQSPIEAGAYAVDQHNEGMTWMQSLLQNSARPSGALVSDAELTDEQFSRLKHMVEDSHSGARNAGRPMLLEGGLKWQQMSLSPSDMGILEVKYSSARDVCLAFGVPPQLLGIPGDNTYSNYQEARLAFWEDTAIPLVKSFAQDWTNWLGDGVEIRPNMDEIPAIVDKRATLWEMADKSDDLTINERREMKGYPPLPDGDVLQQRKPQGISPELAKRLAYGD